MRKHASVMLPAGVAAFALLLGGCPPSGNGPTSAPAAIAVNPMCEILAVSFLSNPMDDEALRSEGTNSNGTVSFSRFQAISQPRGNRTVGGTADVYGISEAWLRKPGAAVVVRAQAHPALLPNSTTDFGGSGTTINFQDATGTWLGGGFIKNSDGFREDPATGGAMVPRLMPVGVANPQMFACAGALSDDEKVFTTSLFEIKAPDPATNFGGSVTLIQDLLNGDDHFDPNKTLGQPIGGLGPQKPPTPKVSGPGNPVTQGNVQCAMLQSQDDLTTRELHMLAIDRGTLYHSVATKFATATGNGGAGVPFQRFSSVTAWGDVGQALGGNFGTITAATVVASRPNAISVLFAAQMPGGTRLFHAVRFSSGAWRPADDVLLLSGGSPVNLTGPFGVAAGMCPAAAPGNLDPEIVYTFWDANQSIVSGRIGSIPQQQGPPALPGVYSPMVNLTSLRTHSTDPSRNPTLSSMSIVTRPFSDRP